MPSPLHLARLLPVALLLTSLPTWAYTPQRYDDPYTFVQDAYLRFLGRTTENVTRYSWEGGDREGVDFWAGQYAGNLNHCNNTQEYDSLAWLDCRDFARVHIIRAFLESIEFQNKFNLTPGSDNADMILALYRHGLGREPNAAPDTDWGGYNYWLAHLNSHNDRNLIIYAFVCSLEFQATWNKTPGHTQGSALAIQDAGEGDPNRMVLSVHMALTNGGKFTAAIKYTSQTPQWRFRIEGNSQSAVLETSSDGVTWVTAVRRELGGNQQVLIDSLRAGTIRAGASPEEASFLPRRQAEPAPELGWESPSVYAHSNAQQRQICIHRANAGLKSSWVRWYVAGGTAVQGVDYWGLSDPETGLTGYEGTVRLYPFSSTYCLTLQYSPEILGKHIDLRLTEVMPQGHYLGHHHKTRVSFGAE